MNAPIIQTDGTTKHMKKALLVLGIVSFLLVACIALTTKAVRNNTAAETARAEAANDKATAERFRTEAANDRTMAEKARTEAANDKQMAEKARTDATIDRAIAENARLIASTDKATAERARTETASAVQPAARNVVVLPAEKPTKVTEPASAAELGKTQEKSKVGMPESQNEFMAIMKEFINAYQAAPTDLKKSILQRQRARKIETFFERSGNSKLEFVDWVVTLTRVTDAGSRGAAVRVRFPGVSIDLLTTLRDQILVPPDSNAYQTVADLGVGKRVRVSGEFRLKARDYIHEDSTTEEGSMTEPEFVVRFSKIEKY